MSESGRLANVYVEYSLRLNLPEEHHRSRKCCTPESSIGDSDYTLISPEDCAKNFLDSLPEDDKQVCLLAERAQDKEVDTLLRRKINKYSSEEEVSALLYQIWYNVLLRGTTTGCILSCITVCGMVATIATEQGIPLSVTNLTDNIEDLLRSKKQSAWSYVKYFALHMAVIVGGQFLVSVF